jgi:hypothetical protein
MKVIAEAPHRHSRASGNPEKVCWMPTFAGMAKVVYRVNNKKQTLNPLEARLRNTAKVV